MDRFLPPRRAKNLMTSRYGSLLALLICTSTCMTAAEYQFRDHGVVRSFELEQGEVAYRSHTAQAKVEDGRTIQRKSTFAVRTRSRDRAVADANADSDAMPVLYLSGRPHTIYSRRIVTEKVLVRTEQNIGQLGASVGATRSEATRAAGYALLTFPTAAAALAASQQLQEAGVDAAPQLARQADKRDIPDDRHFPFQWHLDSTRDDDINAPEAWDYVVGAGITIAIVDDGVQLAHPDLDPNMPSIGSGLHWDFNDNDADPSPVNLEDDHGTQVAGCASARGDNSIGVSGSAREAWMLGVRLTADSNTDQQEADALNWQLAGGVVDIYNNSWGPNDDGDIIQGPDPLAAAAIATGVASGRGSKGAIYVWAGGNGNLNGDNSNFDGYANSPYTIAVGATTIGAVQADFSEPGSNLVVCAPGDFITTTDWTDINNDLGANNDSDPDPLLPYDYTSQFGGTSAATPIVAGVVALMLDQNANLGWRDVQEILMLTARKIDSSDLGWFDNGCTEPGKRFHFNAKYGAGLVDAYAAVRKSTSWSNLGPRISVAGTRAISTAIPDGSATGVTVNYNFSSLTQLRVEHVQITVNVSHGKRKQLSMTLESPSGTVSEICVERPNDEDADFNNWTFMTVQNWGEESKGTWKLRVIDHVPGIAGALTSATVTIWGTENHPPVAVADAYSTNEDTKKKISISSLLDNDTDEDGNTLTLTRVSSPVNGTVAITGSSVTFTPDENFFGTASFRYTINDGYNQTDSALVTITVNPVPDAAIITIDSPEPFQTFPEGTTEITVVASADDPDGVAVTSFTVSDGTTTLSATPFTFTGTLAGGVMASGTYTYNLVATDSTGLLSYASITVIVDGSHPTITSTPILHAHDGEAYSYDANADTAGVTWSLIDPPGAPGDMTINAGTGVIAWPDPEGPSGASGHVAFSVRAETATGFDIQEVLLYVSHEAGIVSR
jgi:subtilisin-like proprotein convertase family protein